MKAQIKAILSPDIEDLASYEPLNPENFGFALQLLIGPQDLEGLESYQVTVCTPQWLSTHYEKDRIVIGRHHLIVFEYNYPRLLEFMTRYVERHVGSTWRDIANRLSRFGQWEFEDYVEYNGQ